MKHQGRLLDILDRAENGPMIDEKEFERKLVAVTARRLIEEYGIQFDDETIVPSDDEMIDRLFQAGIDFAVEVGMLCTSTSRRITWTREEFEDALRYCPSEAILGEGADAVIARARVPEDTTPAIIVGGPYGIVVPEELFVPMMISYAQEPVIDVLDNPTLASVYGRSPKAASPWEVLGGWREAELSFQAINRVGRQGMCISGVEFSPTALGEISASSWGAFRPSDLHHVAGVSEFKTNYEALSKVAHTTRIGGLIHGYLASFYGGYFGGAAGVAIALTAQGIVLNQNYMAALVGLSAGHPLRRGSTREILWADSLASQALSRNTNLLISSLAAPSGGPGTKTMLYENATHALVTTTSGQSYMQASMSAGGTHARHASGLDAKIVGEVSHASLGMTREQANEIAQQLYVLYEPTLDNQQIGQPFEEVYDPVTVNPTVEWTNTYREVMDELFNLGIPF